MKRIIKTDESSPPQGTYSQAVSAQGETIYISGQTPRRPDGTLVKDCSFEDMARQTMKNLEAVARAAECTIAEHCVKATVYLRDLEDRHDFDRVFAEFVGDKPPSRTIVQSNFTSFSVEVDAILVK